MSSLTIIGSVSVVIFLAEIGDKTNLVALSLMSKTKMPYVVAFGAVIGIGLTTLIGVLIGKVVGDTLPLWIIPFVAGLSFIILGLVEFFGKSEEKEEIDNNKIQIQNSIINTLKRSIVLVMFAEFGDKSQLAVITGVTLGSPIPIFIGAIIGMSLVMMLTAIFGDKLLAKIPEEKLHIVASALFIIAGCWIIISAIFQM